MRERNKWTIILQRVKCSNTTDGSEGYNGIGEELGVGCMQMHRAEQQGSEQERARGPVGLKGKLRQSDVAGSRWHRL